MGSWVCSQNMDRNVNLVQRSDECATWRKLYSYVASEHLRGVFVDKLKYYAKKMEVYQIVFSFMLSLLCIDSVYGYFVTIDAHAEECFFDKVVSGTKMSLMFEVAEGGFLDIDVRVCNSTSLSWFPISIWSWGCYA